MVTIPRLADSKSGHKDGNGFFRQIRKANRTGGKSSIFFVFSRETRMTNARGMVAAATFAVASLLPLSQAAAIDIAPIGGTAVILTATPALVGTGVAITPLGSASLTPDASANLIGLFPITGGFLDPDITNANILHNGSGLLLTRGTQTINLENFVIDTTLPTDTIFGTVTVGTTTLPGLVPLFTLQGVNVFLTSEAGGALATNLGIPNLSGVQVGFALTNPIPVPEPGTYLLMGLGLAFLGLMRQARKGRGSTFAVRSMPA